MPLTPGEKNEPYLSLSLTIPGTAPSPPPVSYVAAYRKYTVDRAGTPPPKAVNGGAAGSGTSRQEESTGPMTRRRKKADATAASD